MFNDEKMFYFHPSDGPLHMGCYNFSLAFGVCGKNIEHCHVGSKHYSLVLLQLKGDMLFQQDNAVHPHVVVLLNLLRKLFNNFPAGMITKSTIH